MSMILSFYGRHWCYIVPEVFLLCIMRVVWAEYMCDVRLQSQVKVLSAQDVALGLSSSL